jgi:hypothetical protein
MEAFCMAMQHARGCCRVLHNLGFDIAKFGGVMLWVLELLAGQA